MRANGYNKDLDGIHLTHDIGAWVNEKSLDGSAAEAKPSYSKRRQLQEKQILEIDNPMLKKAILQSRNIIRRFNERSPKWAKLKSKEARK